MEKKDLLHEEVAETVEAEFEDIQEENNIQIPKGIVIYHSENGAVSYQTIGELTLENITYYRRYLDVIEKALWEEYSKPKQSDVNPEKVGE